HGRGPAPKAEAAGSPAAGPGRCRSVRPRPHRRAGASPGLPYSGVAWGTETLRKRAAPERGPWNGPCRTRHGPDSIGGRRRAFLVIGDLLDVIFEFAGLFHVPDPPLVAVVHRLQ